MLLVTTAAGYAFAVNPVDVLAEVDAECADRVGGDAGFLHGLLHARHRLRVLLLRLLGLHAARDSVDSWRNARSGARSTVAVPLTTMTGRPAGGGRLRSATNGE